MELGERPRPIRSVQYGSIEIGIDLYEHVAVPNGPDVLRIARPKAPRVARTGPVERNGYDVALGELVEVLRPGALEEGQVHHRMAVHGRGVELVLA